MCESCETEQEDWKLVKHKLGTGGRGKNEGGKIEPSRHSTDFFKHRTCCWLSFKILRCSEDVWRQPAGKSSVSLLQCSNTQKLLGTYIKLCCACIDTMSCQPQLLSKDDFEFSVSRVLCSFSLKYAFIFWSLFLSCSKPLWVTLCRVGTDLCWGCSVSACLDEPCGSDTLCRPLDPFRSYHFPRLCQVWTPNSVSPLQAHRKVVRILVVH